MYSDHIVSGSGSDDMLPNNWAALTRLRIANADQIEDL